MRRERGGPSGFGGGALSASGSGAVRSSPVMPAATSASTTCGSNWTPAAALRTLIAVALS